MDRDTGPICIQDRLPNILDTAVECCTLVCTTHFVLHQTHVAQHHTHVVQHHTHQQTTLNPSTLNIMDARSQRAFCIANTLDYHGIRLLTQALIYHHNKTF